jgi:hypothetical protein
MKVKSGLNDILEIPPCTLRNSKNIFYCIERRISSKVANSVTK